MKYQPYDHIKDGIINLSREEKYERLLMTNEWLSFRKLILDRDSHRCRICGKNENEYIQTKISLSEWEQLRAIEIAKGSKEGFFSKFDCNNIEISFRQYVPPDIRVDKITLQVHHKLYIVGHLPWEYEQEHLISVCTECHRKIHETETIFVYSDQSLEQGQELPLCGKCNGSGFLEQYEYYYNGVCFNCMGEGVLFEADY